MLFSEADCELVSALLAELASLEALSPALLERIQFAVLKLSGGDLNALQQALDRSRRDWRDVLMAAGFGSDVKAHESWWPETAPALRDA